MLHLQLLGGLALRASSDVQGAGGQRKALLLLAVIASAPNGGITREKLLGYFWPDATEERAKNALRQRLFALRRDLGEDALFAAGTELRLNPEIVTTDLWAFDHALAVGDLEGAAAAYGGPFLDGVHVSDSPELERWMEQQRASLASRASGVLTALATRAADRGDHLAAAAHWQRLASLDMTSARAASGLIAALADAGDAPAALNHYRLYCALLRSELDVEPDPAVASLAESIQHGTRVPRAARTAVPASPSASQHTAETDVDVAPTLPNVASAAVPAAPAPARRLPRTLIAASVGVVTLSAAAVALFVRSRPPDTPASPRILVTDFRNETGDTTLAHIAQAAATTIGQELGRGTDGTIIDSRVLFSARERASDSITPLEAARRVGATQVITGAIVSRGDSVFAEASIVDAATGTTTRSLLGMGAPRDSASRLLAPMGRKLAGTVSALNDPLFLTVTGANAEPPNREALAEYQQGMMHASRMRWDTAIPHFRRAFGLDSSFVQAALWLLEDQWGAEADSVVALLQARRDRLTALERARLDFRVAYNNRDLEMAFQSAREMERQAPNSWLALHPYALMAYHTRRFDEAAAAYRRVDLTAEWPANWVGYYGFASKFLHHARQHEEELRVLSVGRRRHPHDEEICITTGRAYAALGRLRDLRRLAEECAALSPRGVDFGYTLYYRNVLRDLRVHGHRALADSLWDITLARAEAHARRDTTAGGWLAELYLWAGRYQRAHELWSKTSNATLRPVVLGYRAYAAIRSGDSVSARQYRARLEALPAAQRRPQQLSLMRIAAAEGRLEDALRMAEEWSADGGLAMDQLYADPLLEALWEMPRWKAIFRSR